MVLALSKGPEHPKKLAVFFEMKNKKNKKKPDSSSLPCTDVRKRKSHQSADESRSDMVEISRY